MQRDTAVHEQAPAGLPSILVVDDEHRILNFVSRGLRAQGYEVDTAHDGIEGLSKVLGGRYDLVVLDLLLPGLDGVSVLRRILGARPTQKVIVLSAQGSSVTKVECLELGNECLKRISVEEVLSACRELLAEALGKNKLSVIS